MFMVVGKFQSKQPEGFSLIELIVVIAGLGILAGLAIPNFIKYLEFAQVDEAKSLLNAAAAECLQRYRSSPNEWVTHEPDALKSRSLPGNYQYAKDSSGVELKTCPEISIYDPTSETESTNLISLSFTLAGGKVIKQSQFFSDETEQACKSWGNCGGSPQAQYLKQCNLNKQTCEQNLSAELAKGLDKRLGFIAWTGVCSWPADASCGCTKEVWSCDGRAQYSVADFEACLTAKRGAACNAHLNSLKSKTGFTHDTVPNPCDRESWWLNGSEVDRCDYEFEKWKIDNTEGAFSASGCTKTGFKCQVPNVGMKVFENTSVKPSDCEPPPPPPQPPTPTPPAPPTTLPSCLYLFNKCVKTAACNC